MLAPNDNASLHYLGLFLVNVLSSLESKSQHVTITRLKNTNGITNNELLGGHNVER
jgi:hypothetical protein